MKNFLSAGRKTLGMLAVFFGLFGIFDPALAVDKRPEIVKAIVKEDLARLEAAINRGDDVNAVYDQAERHKDTMLGWAIARGTPEMVRLLLQSPGIDVNKQGIEPFSEEVWIRSPLAKAASNGQAEVVDMLLKRGARIDDRCNFRLTALLWATRSDHLKTVEVLLNNPTKPDVNAEGITQTPPLWYAVIHENLEMLTLLHHKGAKLDRPDKDGISILTKTLLHKKYNVLDYLVANGANINRADNTGVTPLINAAESSRMEHSEQVVVSWVKKFLRFKPILDLQFAGPGKVGYTALHSAAFMNSPEIVQILLDAGMNINQLSIGSKGNTLHYAVNGKHADMVEFLLKRGAKTEIFDVGNFSPLQLTVSRRDLKTMRALLEGGALPDNVSPVGGQNPPLIWAATSISPLDHDENMEIMQLLLDSKADINLRNSQGNTALIGTSATSPLPQAYEKARFLIDRGAKLDAVNKRGETALMLAAGTGNEKLVKLLVDKGANTQLKNAAGETVMSYANRRGNNSVSSLLESSGVKQEAPVVKPKVVVGALLGSWQGSKDGLPQAVLRFVFKKDNTYEFVSKLAPEVLKQLPRGSVSPVIATHKGSYTVDQENLILYPAGVPPVGMTWQLANGGLVLDGNTRLKK
jgi:ankyrin repeat protein